jgi:hypothetical protein
MASLTIYSDPLLQVSDNPEANLKRIGAVVHTDRTQVDVNVVAHGSMDWTAAEDLRNEKKTADITLGRQYTHPDSLWLIAVEKPADDTAGDLTVNVYNVIKIDNSNARDTFLTSFTVPKISGSPTYQCYIVQGLFVERSIKLGFKFEADSGAITVHFKIFRL